MYKSIIIHKSANFRGFRASWNPWNIMSNEIQNVHIIIFDQSWNREYIESTIPGRLLENWYPRITVLSQYTYRTFNYIGGGGGGGSPSHGSLSVVCDKYVVSFKNITDHQDNWNAISSGVKHTRLYPSFDFSAIALIKYLLH